MASEDVKTSESAVSKIVNLAEEAKLAGEGVKAPSYAVLSICKSLVAGGVAGAVWVFLSSCFTIVIIIIIYISFVLSLWKLMKSCIIML